MKNITLKIDEATYRKARVHAAERETSVSAMVREFLENLGTESDPETEKARLAERKEQLQKLWVMADDRDRERSGKAGPFTRDEIYEERLR